MNIKIRIRNEEIEFNLYNFQYWNQRMFCLGMTLDGKTIKNFISTKGFDKLLVSTIEAVEGSGYFHFKKEHFNPYLCSREKDIWKESQLLAKHGNNFKTDDVGPSSFTGHYEICMDLGPYRDDIYFETKLFEIEGFDLFKYQTDDIYYIIHQSKNRDNELPKLIDQSDGLLFGKISIIHGVNEEASKDFFDFASLYGICDADLGYPSFNSFYSIIRAYNSNSLLRIMRIGSLDFIRYDEIQDFKIDCGNSYIRKNILHRNVKRKHCFRYLYEYYSLILTLMLSRRKRSSKPQSGPKEFKKFDWVPVFAMDEMINFKIVFFKDIFTSERKDKLTRTIAGDSIFIINGFYDYIMGYTVFDDFKNESELVKYVKKNIGIAESIKLAKILSIWFKGNLGYTPRQCILPVALKANTKPIVDSVSIYSIPNYEDNGEFYSTSSYVNLFGLLATFALEVPKVKNMLKMNDFSSSFFKEIDTSFTVYHICRDVRRGLFKWDDDKELSECMISMNDALRLIQIFEHLGKKKNSFWYGNANNFLQSYPDTPVCNISERYSDIGLFAYIESLKDEKM